MNEATTAAKPTRRSSVTQTTINADILKTSVLVTIRLTYWDSRRSGNTQAVETDCKKDRMFTAKHAIDSQEYRDIRNHQEHVKSEMLWWMRNSGIADSMYWCPIARVKQVKAIYEEGLAKLNDVLVPRFLKVYPAQREVAREDLKSQYNPADYPADDVMAKRFTIQMQIVELSVPAVLSAEDRAAETAKLRALIEESQAEVRNAIRVNLASIVDKMVNKLKGVGADKKLNSNTSEALCGNFNDFFETFSTGNLTNDTDLAGLVQRAKDIMKEVTPGTLRDNTSIREATQKAFEQVKVTVDELVKNRPARSIRIA